MRVWLAMPAFSEHAASRAHGLDKAQVCEPDGARPRLGRFCHAAALRRV